MNAKEELKEHCGYVGKKIHCAFIHGESYYDDTNDTGECRREAKLCIGYSYNEWLEFMDKLDFIYDAGYGAQQLFGNIWWDDMSWSSRSEYDGSEWWAHHTIPEIPLELWRSVKSD